MDLLRFWKSESLSQTRAPGRKRQPSKRGFLRTRSALLLSNGCGTASKQQAWNLRKVERECAERRRREDIVVVIGKPANRGPRGEKCQSKQPTRFLTTPAATLRSAIWTARSRSTGGACRLIPIFLMAGTRSGWR